MNPEVRTTPVTERIESESAARTLLSERSRQTLAAFLTPSTLSEAAKRLAQPLNTVKHHLERLVTVGLLHPEPQGQGPQRYCASSRQFFIPYELTPLNWPQDILTLLHHEWEAQLTASMVASAQDDLIEQGVWGVQVVQQGNKLVLDHAVRHSPTWNFTHPDAPAVLDLFVTMQLDHADAKNFQLELLGLVSRYKKRGGAQPRYLRLTLVPAFLE